MNIVKIEAKETFDATGNVTLACCIDLEDGTRVSSRVPSSFFSFESITEHQKFVAKTADTITNIFAPALIERVPDLKLMDAIIAELNESHGTPLIRPGIQFLISSAICKAQAVVYQCEVFELLADLANADTVCLPFPLITILDNIMLSSNHAFPFQKISLIPLGEPDFKTSCKHAFQITQELKKHISASAQHACITADGGLSIVVDSLTQPFDNLMKALKETGLNEVFVIAVECNVEALYNKNLGLYVIGGQDYTPEALCDFYKKLADMYPLFSLEDCFARDDQKGWKLFDDQLGETLQIVGNKLFSLGQSVAQNTMEDEAMEEIAGFVSSVVVQPYHIGTLTENLEIVQAFKAAGANIVIAHDIIETEETFIADFAVGVSAGQVKIGGLSRSEHVAKYNRLLEIEDALISHALEQID